MKMGKGISGYLRLENQCDSGWGYQATVFRLITKSKFRYEHLISKKFGWKMALNKSS